MGSRKELTMRLLLRTPPPSYPIPKPGNKFGFCEREHIMSIKWIQGDGPKHLIVTYLKQYIKMEGKSQIEVGSVTKT